MGKSIIYDTVSQWNWSVDVRTHPIRVIIDKLLAEDWDVPANGSVVEGRLVPAAKPEEDCVVSVGHGAMPTPAEIYIRNATVGNTAIFLILETGEVGTVSRDIVAVELSHSLDPRWEHLDCK